MDLASHRRGRGRIAATLSAGALEVHLAPSLGGSIARFDRVDERGERQPLFRPAGLVANDILGTGCFPLVPFANRIRGGRFACDGRDVTLAPDLPGDPSPLHGQGWRGVWTMAEHGDRHAVLAFRHDPGEWRWAYEAQQRIDLDENGLSLRLSCRNLSPERMPCGLGFHPYYPCDRDTLLDTGVESAWTIDDAVLPVANVPALGHYDLRHRSVCAQGLDNGFDGWDGRATITWPRQSHALRLTSPDAGRFQLFSPREGGLFVAEPVQNANCALNGPQERWPELGITLLGQGEERALHTRFDVVAAETGGPPRA